MNRPGVLSLISKVLRDPGGLVQAADTSEDFSWLAPRLLGMVLVGATLFGVVVGTYRGGLQLAFAGVKMPVLLLAPIVVALPAIRALYGFCDVHTSYARIALAGLVGTARTAILAAALGPAVWLLYSLEPDYHLSILILAAALMLVGLPGMTVVARSLPDGGKHRWAAALGSMLVLGLVTAQAGWLLRPFVTRPTAEVSFLRPVEEDVFSSLGATTRSAMGVYSGWDVQSQGLLGSGLSRDDDPERRSHR